MAFCCWIGYLFGFILVLPPKIKQKHGFVLLCKELKVPFPAKLG